LVEKTLALHNQRTGTGPSTPEKIIPTKDAVTQARDEVTGEAKRSHYIACITKEIQTTRQEIIQYS
jgi:hypothetical protein